MRVGRCAVVLVLVVARYAFAEPPPDAVYVELGGSAFVYSIDYERLLAPEVALRAGVSYLPRVCGGTGCAWIEGSPSTETAPNAALWQFPVTVSYLGFRKGRHGVELGAGGAVTYVSHAGSASGAGAGAFVATFVGYRLQPIEHAGFLLRAGLSLAAGNFHGAGFGMLPWPYVAVGAGF